MILSILGCATAVLTAQHNTASDPAPTGEIARFITSIQNYAEDHGSGPVLDDDNLTVDTKVTDIDQSHIAYQLVIAARESNLSKLDHADTALGFAWQNAFEVQVDRSEELGWRVTVFLKKPVKCVASMTPSPSKMTTTMVLNERAQPFSHPATTQIDQCYFWFGTQQEANSFRDLLVNGDKQFTGNQLSVVSGNIVREAEYGLPDGNTVTWHKHIADALLDGVIPYEPKLKGAAPADGAEVLATGQFSRMKAGDIITGIKLEASSDFTTVHGWGDVREFLSKNRAQKVVVQLPEPISGKSIEKTVFINYTPKK